MENPKIRFKGFTKDWEQRKFSDIASRESVSRESSYDLPSLEYEDVIAEEGRLNKDISLKENIKKGIVFDGSQVLYGKLRPYLHNWLNPDFSGVAVGDWWVLKPNNADKSFIYRLIQTQRFDDIANQSAGSKMPRADWNLVSNTEFAIPVSQEEQEKIGEYFSSLDHLITLHQRKCEQTKNLKKYMLQKMFPQNGAKVPEIRFNGFTHDWEQRKFSDIASRESVSRESSYDLPSLEYEDVIAEEGRLNKDISLKENIKKGIVFDGSQVLYGKLRPYLHNWLNPDFSGVAVGDWWVLKPNNADKSFIYRLIQTQRFDDIANQSAGSKMPRADWNLVSNTEFAIPVSQEEQEKIGEYFSSLDHLITLHQRKCEQTKNLKKYMLQKMFPQNGAKVPEIRFNGFTHDWEQRKLIDYLEVSSEKNRDNRFTKEDVLSVSGEYGIVNQIEFQGRSFAGASVSNYGVVENGDVVYTKSPLKSNPYGIIKTNKGIPGIVSTLYAVYKPKEITDSKFVQIYFELDSRMNSYMHPLVNKGAKNDMKVSAENALKGMVSFPKKDEQEMISLYFSTIDHLITLHQRKCDELKKMKKFMLQNMFI